MAKLKKREMIILGLAGAVVLLGAVNLLLPSGKSKQPLRPASSSGDLQTFINNINVSIGQVASKDGDAVMAAAQKDWTPDPFLETGAYKKWALAKPPVLGGKTAEKKIEFNYTGFLESGRKRMAIINGIEYKEGEKLEIKGYMLKSASPQSIVIENTLTGIRQTFPLKEEDEGIFTKSK